MKDPTIIFLIISIALVVIDIILFGVFFAIENFAGFIISIVLFPITLLTLIIVLIITRKRKVKMDEKQETILDPLTLPANDLPRKMKKQVKTTLIVSIIIGALIIITGIILRVLGFGAPIISVVVISLVVAILILPPFIIWAINR